jgi:hypothetical protein
MPARREQTIWKNLHELCADLEAEIKTYESVKILDARQEDRLEELLADLESCRPPEPDRTLVDCRY